MALAMFVAIRKLPMRQGKQIFIYWFCAHEYYQTDRGGFCSPIIFFNPSGEFQPGMRNAIAQQIDIMPTVLSYLGYDKKYVGFGIDLLTTPAKDT